MTGSRGIERRVARLEEALGIASRADEATALREAERLVREAQKMAAGNGKPVRGQHSLDLAVAFLLLAGEDRYALSSVAREGYDRYERIEQTGIWVVEGKWWDNREAFCDWVWQSVERCSGEVKGDPRVAAAELCLLRAFVGAFREPTPLEQLGREGPPILLIGDVNQDEMPVPEV